MKFHGHFYLPVPSEGQKGTLGRKPCSSAEVQREERERAALADLDLRRPRGQFASEGRRGQPFAASVTAQKKSKRS